MTSFFRGYLWTKPLSEPYAPPGTTIVFLTTTLFLYKTLVHYPKSCVVLCPYKLDGKAISDDRLNAIG